MEKLNTFVQVVMIICGFIVAAFEIWSGEFKKGQRKHNVFRASKIAIGFLVALLGAVSWYSTGVIEQRKSEQLKVAESQIASHKLDLQAAREELASVRAETDAVNFRKVANVRPNGREVVVTGGSRFGSFTESLTDSTISKELGAAFKAINSGNSAKAQKLLTGITRKMPEWPYAYFYLGLITGDSENFRKCLQLSQKWRNAKIVEPEPVLFEAMSQTFVGNFDGARKSLSLFDSLKTQVDLIPIVTWGKKTPRDIVQRFLVIKDANKKRQRGQGQPSN